MRQPIILIPAGVGFGLFAAASIAGPVLAAGGVLAVGLAVLIYLLPVAGLAFMFVTGTVLQVLGSEHFIGLPLSLNKISAGMTLAIWAARSIILRIPLTQSRQVYAMLGFLLVVAAAGAVSPDPQESREGFVRYLQVVVLMVMIANIAGESRHALDIACIALTASMVASTLLGLAEFLLPSLMVESDDPSLGQGTIGAVIDRDSLDGVEIKRITGGVGDSNWFGYTLALVLPVNLYLFYRFQAPAARLLIIAAAGLQSMGVVLSFTRSAILGAGVAVIWLVIRGRLPLKPLLLAGAIGAAGFAAWNPAGLERIYSSSYAQGGSTPVRTVMMMGGLHLISRSPIVGYGYNQYGPNLFAWMLRQHDLPPDAVAWERALYTQAHPGDERLEWINAHNTYIQLWVEFGLGGMLAFLALLYFMVSELRTASRLGDENQKILADCLIASALGFVVCCLFGSLLLTKISWFITGLAAALYRVTTTQARTGQG
jgi:O-antigen ligase